MRDETSQLQILVVDDEPFIVDLYVVMLDMTGYSCTTANSGAHAVAILDEKPIDILVTDATMPGMHGIELLEHFLENSPDTRRIMITGDPGTLGKTRELIDRQLAHRVIAKPCDTDTFQQAIRDEIGKVPIG